MIPSLPLVLGIGAALVAALPITFVLGRRSGQRTGRAAAEAAPELEAAAAVGRKVLADALS